MFVDKYKSLCFGEENKVNYKIGHEITQFYTLFFLESLYKTLYNANNSFFP